MKRALVIAGLMVAAAPFVACKKEADPANVGVPECDAYVTKYEACLAKMAPAGQASAKESFAAQRSAFRANATTPEARQKLADQCRAALEAIKPTCGS